MEALCMFEMQEAGVGGMILKVSQKILSSRTKTVKIDGVCSSSIDVVSGVPKGSVLGPLFLFYIADLPWFLQNVLVGYAGDSTLFCRMPHSRDRESVATSLNDDFALISDCCNRWGTLVKGTDPFF